MKIVLDECVPWPLAKHLAGHLCTSPQRKGWGGYENGDLLKLAEQEFDLFVTFDQNLRNQQNLSDRKIAILELCPYRPESGGYLNSKKWRFKL